MIKVDQLEASKVDRSKQRGMRRAEWNAGPWEKNVREESGDDGKWCGEDCRIYTVV